MVYNSGFGRFGRACAVALIVAATVSCGQDDAERESSSFPADLAAKIDEIATSGMAAALFPGMMVAVVDPERGSYVHAYGVSDIATGRAATVHDSVRIGSVTKTFTATAVLRLADEGRLSLDDKLDRYVEKIPYGDVITLRDLLDMRAGVWDVQSSAGLSAQLIQKNPASEWREGDTLRTIIENPDRATPPDTRTAYSNSNFFLLGLVLEKVTGKPVREVLNDLANRYGLHETGYPADASMPDPVSHGYAYFDEQPTDVTARTTPAFFGAAGTMVSTISDLATYTGMLGRGDLLRAETFRDRIRLRDNVEPGAMRYGQGMMLMGNWLGHNGAVSGYTTQIGYLPDRKLAVAVAVNQYTIPPAMLWLQASEIWSMIVAALYPDAQGEGSGFWNAPTPAVPSVDQLNTQLRQAFDPAVPAADRAIRAQGDTKDPELLTRLGSFFAKLGLTLTVDRVTRIGQGVYATGKSESVEGKTPVVVPLVAEDGQWRINLGWACVYVRAARGTSPACG